MKNCSALSQVTHTLLEVSILFFLPFPLTLHSFITHPPLPLHTLNSCTENLSSREIISCMSKIFITIATDHTMALPLGVGRYTWEQSSVTPTNSSKTTTTSVAATRVDHSISRKRDRDCTDVYDFEELNSKNIVNHTSNATVYSSGSQSPLALNPVMREELKQCVSCDDYNPFRARYCCHCSYEL